MGKTLVWVALGVLVVWYFLNKTTTTIVKAAPISAQAAGYGLGQGLVDEGVSAVGSFLSSTLKSSTSTTSASSAASSYTAPAPSYTLPDDDLMAPDPTDDDLFSDSTAGLDGLS